MRGDAMSFLAYAVSFCPVDSIYDDGDMPEENEVLYGDYDDARAAMAELITENAHNENLPRYSIAMALLRLVRLAPGTGVEISHGLYEYSLVVKIVH